RNEPRWTTGDPRPRGDRTRYDGARGDGRAVADDAAPQDRHVAADADVATDDDRRRVSLAGAVADDVKVGVQDEGERSNAGPIANRHPRGGGDPRPVADPDVVADLDDALAAGRDV